MSDDLNFQNLSTVQNNLQPMPKTIASATTIAPTGFLTFLTGSTQVATITPPVTGVHMLAIVGGTGTYLTTGNILTAVVPTADIPTLFIYDPIQAKYYGMAGNLT